MLGHDNEELQGLTQLNGTSDEFGSAVPSSSNVSNHQHRWDFAADTSGLKVSADGWAVDDLLSQGTKLKNS